MTEPIPKYPPLPAEKRHLGYPAAQKAEAVERALALMAEHPDMGATVAAAQAGREINGASGETVMRWANDAGTPLSRAGFQQQKLAAARRYFYSHQSREQQREELLSLIDLEIANLRAEMRRPKKDGTAINLAQRISQLASAHGALSTHSRNDHLHGLRIGDIEQGEKPRGLDGWDGDPDGLPADVDPRIVDLAATRRRASSLLDEEGA